MDSEAVRGASMDLSQVIQKSLATLKSFEFFIILLLRLIRENPVTLRQTHINDHRSGGEIASLALNCFTISWPSKHQKSIKRQIVNITTAMLLTILFQCVFPTNLILCSRMQWKICLVHGKVDQQLKAQEMSVDQQANWELWESCFAAMGLQLAYFVLIRWICIRILEDTQLLWKWAVQCATTIQSFAKMNPCLSGFQVTSHMLIT